MVECFLDTNTFLHFRPIDEIGWKVLADSESVTVTVCATVIRELDRLKTGGDRRKLRERAQTAIRRLEQWSEAGESPTIADGVQLRFVVGEPVIDWRDLGLDVTVQDDRILAAALAQPMDNGVAVAVVTADLGLGLKASKLHGLRVIALPDRYRLPDALTDEERETRRRQRLVEEHERRIPKPRIGFVTAGGLDSKLEVLVRPAERPTTDALDDAVQAGKPPAAVPPLTEASGRSDVSTIAIATMMAVGPQEIERYQRDVSAYLDQLRTFFVRQYRFERRRSLTFRVDLEVSNNEGSAPVEDLFVTVHVPDGVIVVDEDSLPDEPQRPRSPARPRTLSEMMQSGLAGLSADRLLGKLDIGSMVRAPVFDQSPGLRIKKTRSYEIQVEHDQLLHGSAWKLPPFYCRFSVPELVRPFSLRCRIQASNILRPIDQELHIIARCAS